ncbi:hypothetical protein [Natrinema soli]|uniref:Uncharacterized protein n=1 Tax=Natrinema soli TaxID=1930624 RepID=A0ABD5SJ69_9EURY|nr:hypothetical protein [Natrinema soli]
MLLGFPFFDVPLVPGLKQLALNAGVGTGATLLSSHFSNPDAEGLV